MINSWRAFFWFLVVIGPGLGCFGAAQVKTVADLDGLKAQAYRGKRLVLLSITSSDPGCWQCKKIAKDFLADREFTEWVERYAVLGEIDLATKSSAARQTMLSTVYAAHAGPVPSLVLVHPDGRRLAQAPHESWPVSQSLADFQSIYAREMEGAANAGLTVTVTNRPVARSNGPPKSAELLWNPAGAKPVQYSGLKLKNIAQSGHGRFALINDQTLMIGETAKVTSDGARLTVKLIEIRDESVVVLLEGDPQPRILKLKDPR